MALFILHQSFLFFHFKPPFFFPYAHFLSSLLFGFLTYSSKHQHDHMKTKPLTLSIPTSHVPIIFSLTQELSLVIFLHGF